MGWDEFADLMRGLSGDTALATVATIRTTTDRDAIQRMTPEQRRMRAEWQRRRALARPEADSRAQIDALQRAIAQAFGGGGHAD